MSQTDLQRALLYGESELGEVGVLNEAANTYTVRPPVSRARRPTLEISRGQKGLLRRY